MIISFVVLHYLSDKDTIECVDSILNNVKYPNLNIVIVDNASTNDSFSVLKNYYDSDLYKSKVFLLSSKENVGFAKGNNIGFHYCKYNLKSDFIVLLNNDVIIEQNNFCDLIIKKWEKKDYYVLGPDIITKDGIHQNPLKQKKWSLLKLHLFNLKNYIRLADSYLLFIDKYLLRFRNKKLANKYIIGDVENVRLHGACLIFSPDYVEKFDGLCDKTFLYMEEDILQMEMDHYDFKMLYSSELSLMHKEDVSTNMIVKNSRKKQQFFLKNLIKSTKACGSRLKELKKNKERILL